MKKTVTLLIFVAFVFTAKAQEADVYKLTANDVEHFIKHYPALKTDLEKFGAKYDHDAGEFILPETVKAMSDFNQVIAKHGYSGYEDFLTKTSSIILAYTAIISDDQMAQGEAEIKRQLAEIDNNSGYTAEQKTMMKAQLQASLTIMQAYTNTYSNSANVAVVKQYVDKLNVLFEVELDED